MGRIRRLWICYMCRHVKSKDICFQTPVFDKTDNIVNDRIETNLLKVACGLHLRMN